MPFKEIVPNFIINYITQCPEVRLTNQRSRSYTHMLGIHVFMGTLHIQYKLYILVPYFKIDQDTHAT